MAKKSWLKKKSHKRFWLGMAVYALIFLAITAGGLYWFWGFMEDYEASRPYIAIDGYMENLTKEHIVDSCAGLIDQVDTSVQSEEACRKVLLDALTEEITYARKASACTQDRQVYVLRCGKQPIGTFAIRNPGGENMVPWEFESESFDLSYLLNQEIQSVRVPEGFSVSLGGVMLDEGHIVNTETEHFEILEDYYESYQPPVLTMHTYQAGPFLGPVPALEIFDRSGAACEYDGSFDHNTLIPSMEEDAREEFNEFIKEFILRYAIYTGRANKQLKTNYSRVAKMVVPGSDLAKRLKRALDGLSYPKNLGLEVTDVTGNHYVQLDQDVYLLDVSYVILSKELDGQLETHTNARFLIIRQNEKLLVESMLQY